MTIDAKYIEYGEVIGEGKPLFCHACRAVINLCPSGEFSKVYEANYNVIPNSPLRVAVKKLKSKIR